MADSANFSVETNGLVTKDKDGIVVIMNPKSGTYNLHLLPTSEKTKIVVAQFLEGDKTLWKEYQWNSRLPKNGTIQFDPVNPIENVFK